MPGTLLSRVSGSQTGSRSGPLKPDADPFKKTEVEVIAGHRKNEVILDRQRAFRSFKLNRILLDDHHARVEMGLDLAVLDAVFDVRLDPVFNVAVHCGIAMNQA